MPPRRKAKRGFRRGRLTPKRLPKKPYKIVGRHYRDRKTGLFRTQKYAKRYPSKIKTEKIYFSLASLKIISPKRTGRTYREQSLKDLFKNEGQRRGARKIFAKWKRAEGLRKIFLENRYDDVFNYVKEKAPRLLEDID